MRLLALLCAALFLGCGQRTLEGQSPWPVGTWVVADPERVAAAHVALLTKSRAAIEAASREGTGLDLSPLLGGASVSEDSMREACVGAVRAMRFEFRASGSVVFGTGDDIMAGSWTRRDGGTEVLIQLEEWRVAARLKWIAWRLAWERRRARLPQPDHLLVLLRADGFSIAECAVALDIRQECIKKRLARWARS